MSDPMKDPFQDHAPGLERAFFDVEAVEESYRIERIEGEVPPWIRGHYRLNGPALFELGGLRYRHWLDGDGMVAALRFDDGGVAFSSRMVASGKLREEREAGRRLYRAFGTAFPGDRLRRGIGLESPINVSVYPFAGTLLAFGEQALPYELDPETLETRGEYTFGGRLNPISPLSAHPHFDPATGEMLSFGISYSARHPSIVFYRFAADGDILLRRRRPIAQPSSVHDFSVSARHAIFYLSPYVLAMDRLIDDGASFMEAASWRPELGSRLLVLDRATGETRAEIAIGAAYCLHLINSFEEDGRLHVDVIELGRPIYDQYDVPELFTEVREARPRRYVVDLEGGTLAAVVDFPDVRLSDFPTVDPRLWTRSYDDFWLLAMSATRESGRKFFDQVFHGRWSDGRVDVWQAPPGSVLGGEPVFLPRPGDDGGAVLCQILDLERLESRFLLFDAHAVASGPIASLRLERPTHLGFHASWESDPQDLL